MRREEQAAIAQGMRERLLASGWLRDVKSELHPRSLRLTLCPREGLHVSERILRLCVNFFGERRPPSRYHDLFCWAAAFVEEVGEQRCVVWVACDFAIGSAGFDALCELLLLGLKLSSGLPAAAESSRFSLDHLVQLYRSTEEVLASSERFVTQMIVAGDDLPTQECELSLQARWLCCPKHRFLFVQRLMLVSWLHHCLDDWTVDQEEEETLPSLDALAAHRQAEPMKRRLSDLLAQSFAPQSWFEAFCAYKGQAGREDWDLPIKGVCQRSAHVDWLCCPFHCAMKAIFYLFRGWLEQFNDRYHLRSWRDEQGYPFGLSSLNGLAVLAHLARVQTRGLDWPAGVQALAAIEVSRFYCLPEGDGE